MKIIPFAIYGMLLLGSTVVQSQWIARNSGTNYDLIDVKAVDATTAFAIGNGFNGSWFNGIILRTTNAGKSWHYIGYSPSKLASMNTVGLHHSWIVGGGFNGSVNEPFIMATTNKGADWNSRSFPVSKSMTAVSFIDTLNGWCTGESGVMFKSTNGGLAWTKLPDFPYATITSLFFKSSLQGLAVGYDLYRTTDGGTSWFLQKDFGSHKTNKMIFISKDTGWACGNGLWRSVDGGMTWNLIDSINAYTSISFIDSKNGWAVRNGSVLNTTNGGSTWVEQLSDPSISSVSMFDRSFGAAVGKTGSVYSYQMLEIIRPKAENVLKVGDWFHIQWKSIVGSGTITLEFSSDGGVHWTEIANNVSVSDDGYFWKIPNIITENATIRLSSPSNAALYAMCDGVFKIQSQAIIGSWSKSVTENNSVGIVGVHTSIVTDGSEGSIIAWRHLADQSEEHSVITLQRISSSGAILWQDTGIKAALVAKDQDLPRIVPDGYGGIYVVWMQYDVANGWNLYAQRIDGGGDRLWGISGVPICLAPEDQSEPNVIASDDGGIIVAWQDNRAKLVTGQDIYAQKIDHNGKSVWQQNGIPVTQHTGPQSFPQLCSDGRGGTFIVWSDFVSQTSYDIYAQRINRSGNTKFTLNGIVISDNTNNQNGQDIVDVGGGQAIITWKDIGDFHKTKVQKIDSNGAVYWTSNGLSISSRLGTSDHPSIVSDNAGGCLVANFTHDSGKVFVQRIHQSGTMPWGELGLLICDKAKADGFPKLSNVVNNTATVVWWDRRNGNQDVFAQRFTLDGSILWTKDGVPVCTHPAEQEIEKDLLVDGSNNQTTVVWMDRRNTSPAPITWDIYASMIGPSGIIGSGTTKVHTTRERTELNISLHQNYPNPFNPVTTIPFSVPIQSDVTVTIYDMLGRQAATVYDGIVGPGEHRVSFDATNLSSGIYFYRLSINDHEWAKMTQVKSMQVIK